jgi:hypothetical protein
LSYSQPERVWKDYLERVDKTIASFASYNQACENAIKAMWLINGRIFKTVLSRWGKKVLPYHQVFVSVYYKRNIVYLQSSHALVSIGFIDPSSNLNRTVYETILRGYLFIVEQKEAEEYFQVIGTKEEDSYFFKKGMSYIRNKLYEPKIRQSQKKLYKMLCTSAHADIKGANLDYPKYLANRIEDNLRIILSLIYANIQMMVECFIDYLDSKTRIIIKDSMEEIASTILSVPLFEPNQLVHQSKIHLKSGNFLNVL